MLGHISGAYAARVHQDLSLGSRFDFNVYSYESEWTMGAEWWIRSNRSKSLEASNPSNPSATTSSPPALATGTSLPADDVHGVIKARASTSNVSTFHLTLMHLVY
jgi:distribution and morphology protein 10